MIMRQQECSISLIFAVCLSELGAHVQDIQMAGVKMIKGYGAYIWLNLLRNSWAKKIIIFRFFFLSFYAFV